MLVFDLMLILLIIISITLLSGTKIMCNTKYFQFIISILVISTNLKTILKGYSLGYISIDILLFLLTLIIICFWVGYRKNKYKYSIHNVEQSDITNIIENYLKNKYIKYKIDYNKIYLNDTNNTIYINDDIDVSNSVLGKMFSRQGRDKKIIIIFAIFLILVFLGTLAYKIVNKFK